MVVAFLSCSVSSCYLHLFDVRVENKLLLFFYTFGFCLNWLVFFAAPVKNA